MNLVENDVDTLHEERNHIVEFSFIRVYDFTIRIFGACECYYMFSLLFTFQSSHFLLDMIWVAQQQLIPIRPGYQGTWLSVSSSL
jgi:hypothetical protein